MNQLPILDCNDCGACCATQCSPPGYVLLLTVSEKDQDEWPHPEDVARIRSLPAEAETSLREYLTSLKSFDVPVVTDDGPCIWLDLETRRCRFYEHRPQICRDFEVGSEGCRSWRDEFNIDVERIK